MTIAFVGRKGSGKTMNMVKMLMEEMKEGRRVITNTPIKFLYRNQWLKSITIEDPKTLSKVLENERRAIIGLDEAPTVLPPQFWHKVSVGFLRALSQARHIGIDMYYTTQGWGHVIKRLRDLTDKVIVCKKTRFWVPRLSRITKYDFIDKVTRKRWVFRWWYPIEAITYSPDLFAHHFLDPKKIRNYEIRREKIYPSQQRRIGKCYDTTFFVEGSVLSNIGKRDLTFKAEEAQDVDPDVVTTNADLVKELIEQENYAD